MRLFSNQGRVAESASGGVVSFFPGEAALALLFFFEVEIGLEFTLEVSVALFKLPPWHLWSPHLR
jgi:hypothetical protein